jgi:hypothetical protein
MTPLHRVTLSLFVDKKEKTFFQSVFQNKRGDYT